MPIVDVSLSLDGTQVDAPLRVEWVRLEMSLQRHHIAQLRVASGDLNELPAVRSRRLETVFSALGRPARLSLRPQTAGLEDREVTFEGFVSSAIHEWQGGGDHAVLVTLLSPTAVLDAGPRATVWENLSAKEIATNIVDQAGIDQYDFSALSPSVLPYETQQDESDWDFLLRLTARDGLWLYYDGRQLIAKLVPETGTSHAVHVAAGAGAARFRELQIEARALPGAFRQTHYFPADMSDAASGSDAAEGTSVSHDLVKLARERSASLHRKPVHLAPLREAQNEGELRRQAEAIGQAWLGTLVVLKASTFHPGLVPGSHVELSGLGKPEDGLYVVDLAVHGWTTRGGYECSLEMIPHAAAFPRVAAPPPWTALQRAVVVGNHDDSHRGMVKVRYSRAVDGRTDARSSTDGQAVTAYVRVATPHGGETAGLVALPEVGDEVIVAHLGGRATQPVVLGSVFSPKTRSPAFDEIKPETSENDAKILLTKSGNLMIFRDTPGKETIELRSPEGKNFFRMTLDGGEKVVLETQGEVSIKAKRTVTIESGGDMTLRSQAALALESRGAMTLKSQDVLTAESMATMRLKSNADLDASAVTKAEIGAAQLKAQGSATAELAGAKVDVKGQAIVSVQGALVKIN